MLLFSIFFLLHQHAQMNTGPHEKSGVKIFLGDPFLTKLTFSKIMRGRKFWRWRAEILHTLFSHPTAPFFHPMFSKIEKSWFSIHPIIYYWGAYYILLVRLRLFFTPTGPAISFTPLRPVATEPYKLNCTPTALRPRATAIFGHSDRTPTARDRHFWSKKLLRPAVNAFGILCRLACIEAQ